MANPALDLAAHKAVRDALVANPDVTEFVGTRVYDRVPAGTVTFPYITIDALEVLDDGNTCSDASELHVTAHIFSNAVGSVEAKRLGGYVRQTLATELAISGHWTSVGVFDAAVYRPAENDLITEGVLTFTYLVDPEGGT